MAGTGELTLPGALAPRRIAVAFVLAAAAHMVAFAFVQADPPRAGGRVATTAPAMLARWIEGQPPREAAASPPLESAPRALPSAAAAVPPLQVARTPEPPTAPATEAEEAAPSTEPPPLTATLSLDRDGLLLDYLPRALLTVVPTPSSSIEVPFPDAINNELHLSAELSLFIDETGVVRQVRFDSAPLPAALEEATRNTFLRARFTPGQVDGHTVRSVIRIEVSFDAETQPGAAPPR